MNEEEKLKAVDSKVLDQYGNEIKNYIDQADQKLLIDITDHELRIEKAEAKNLDQDIDILNLKHIVQDTVIDQVETTIENVSRNPIPNYIDQHQVIDGGELMLSEILGKTMKWNQLLPISQKENTTINGVDFINNQDGTYTFNGTATANVYCVLNINFNTKEDYKYIVYGIGNGVGIYDDSIHRQIQGAYASYIFTGSGARMSVCLRVGAGTTLNNVTVEPKISCLTDIGLDDITSTSDPRVPFLIQYAKDHPDYDEGSLHSVMAENFKVNGKEGNNLLTLNFLQGNQFKTTETKTLGTLTMNADRGKLTLSGISMVSNVATIGNTPLKAGTYSYRIENPAGDNVGLYDITGDDLLFSSSRPVLTGTFTLEQDKTIAMALDARASTNYGGREIRYMVAKGSELLNEFRQDGVTEPIELNGKGTARDKIIIEQQLDMTFNFVKETAMGKVDLGDQNWSKISDSGYHYFRNRSMLTRTDGLAVKPSAQDVITKYQYGTYATNNRIYVSDYYVSIRDDSFDDETSFTNSLRGVMLVYPLAQPIRQTLITSLTETQVATLLEKGGTIEVGNESLALPDVKIEVEVRKLLEA